MNEAFWALIGFTWPPSWMQVMGWASAALGYRVPRRQFFGGWVMSGGAVAAVAGIGGNEPAEYGALASAGVALCFLLHDWWRRRGKRAAKAAGAKSRALIDALVGRMRDTAVPEGARA